MKFALAFAGLLALASAQDSAIPPAKRPLTPFFRLQVADSPANRTLQGQWISIGQGYDSYLRVAGDEAAAAVFYTAQVNLQDAESRQTQSVLVNNATNPQDRSSKWLAGTSTCDSCDPAGLPFSASGFTRSLAGWRADGGFLYDFRLQGYPFSHAVAFSQTDGGSVSNQTRTQLCYAAYEGRYRFVVLAEDHAGCDPVTLRWRFAGW